MSAQEQTQINRPKFIRVSQSLPLKSPLTYESVKAEVEDLYENEFVKSHFAESETKLQASWGTGVYAVQEDGSLKLLASRFDTSD